MKRATLYLCGLAAALFLPSGCACFRPSQTEAERLQEQQDIREQEYLQGTLVEGLLKTAGEAAARMIWLTVEDLNSRSSR